MRARVILALAAFLGAQAAFAQDKVIYGGDDRTDYYAAAPQWRRLADSTAALFRGDKVAPDGTLTLESFKQRHNVCSSERFTDQPSGSYCSGSLVAPDVVMTAGHCIHLPTDNNNTLDMPDCAGIKFVFGYMAKSAGAMPSRVPPGDVYRCAGVVHREFPGIGSRAADFALIRLDRPVKDHAPLQLDRGAGVAVGDGVTVIGTPSGLPTKIAGNAKVRDVSDPKFFVANLDSFGGNSGSSVFDSKTGLIEGIVVRGDSDFRSNEAAGCNVYNVKPEDGGRGEDVIKISLIIPYLDAALAAQRAEAAPRLGLPLAEMSARVRAVRPSFDGAR